MTTQTMATGAVQRMWGGRFASGPAADLDRLNRSLPVDRRLWREDIAGSVAWCAALADAGVLDTAEAATLRDGLHGLALRLAGWSEADWKSRQEIRQVYVPKKAKQTQMLEGTPKEAAAKLVEKLKFEARVL